MKDNLSKFIFLFFVLLTFSIFNANFCFADDDAYGPPGEEEFDSMQKWEQWIENNGSASVHSCSGKIIWDSSELDNTYIPTSLGQDSVGSTSDAHTARTIQAVGTAILTVGSLPAMIVAAGVQYSIMTDICSSNYVIQPHEMMNSKYGGTCSKNSKNEIEWASLGDGSPPFTKQDIPFYFHCDPTYDPVSRTNISIDDNEKSHLIGRTMGYAGAASSFCNDSRITPALGDLKDAVNTIKVEQYNWFDRTFRLSSWKPCENGRESSGDLKPGDEPEWLGAYRLMAYYRLSPTGKVQICAAAPDTFFPIRVGCTATAAPGDETNIDEYLRNYVSDTRCEYLIYPRTDLQSLGRALPGSTSNPVKKFLISDMHLTSTVVGCLKDMLAKIFIKTPNSTGLGSQPFFQTFQDRMYQIVMASLVLYLVIVGLKIMTAGKPPQRHEAIMYVLKFALVVYFALGNGFYEVDSNGDIKGLYPNLIQVPDELSDIFLQAQNINDPGGYCFLPYKGDNILSEREINKGEFPGVLGTQGTRGNSQYVKMTVWDLVDCKIINYLTLGSCDYSIGGMASVWFASASLWVDKIGIIFAIVSLLYTIMVLLTMFKFTHIFILSMFTVTILIFLSPIFLIFALFDPLKEIFQAWMRMILGYLLYPALLFAFVALMFATFDSIFYGDLNITPGDSGTAIGYEQACSGVDSVFCKTQKAVGWRDNCAGGSISQLLLTKTDSQLFGEVTSLSDEVAQDFFDIMLKMLLFAFLFYLFLNSVTEFMASMLRIGGMGQISGVGAVGGPLGQMAGGAAKGLASAATGKAVGGASNLAGRGAGGMAGGMARGGGAGGGGAGGSGGGANRGGDSGGGS